MSTEADSAAKRPSLARRFRRRARPSDALVILSIPVLSTLVYLLPRGLRESLVFDYSDPSLFTAFVSTFVHFDAGHLLANLGMYALVVSVAFALSALSGHRRRFYTVFVTVLLVFPFVLSYLNLAVARPAFAFGTSGVVMAFAGYLPFTLAAYLDDNFGVGPADQIAPLLFLVGLGVVSALSLGAGVADGELALLVTGGTMVAITLCVVWYALAAFERRSLGVRLRRATRRSGDFELAVVALVLCFGVLVVAFPVDATRDDGVVNLYVHLLGYALGFVSVFATAETMERLGLQLQPRSPSVRGRHGHGDR